MAIGGQYDSGIAVFFKGDDRKAFNAIVGSYENEFPARLSCISVYSVGSPLVRKEPRVSPNMVPIKLRQ